jgi:hypothetical protein
VGHDGQVEVKTGGQKQARTGAHSESHAPPVRGGPVYTTLPDSPEPLHLTSDSYRKLFISNTNAYRVFGWGAAGAERSGSAPEAVWMRSGGSGAAPVEYSPPDPGWLRPSKFEGRSRSAPDCVSRHLSLIFLCLAR